MQRVCFNLAFNISQYIFVPPTSTKPLAPREPLSNLGRTRDDSAGSCDETSASYDEVTDNRDESTGLYDGSTCQYDEYVFNYDGPLNKNYPVTKLWQPRGYGLTDLVTQYGASAGRSRSSRVK